MTSDDLVLGDTARFLLELDASEARAVVIEEKLDGGNIGISCGLDGELLVQNRSHYISSGDHAQYRPLFHTWLAEPARRAALEALLPPGGDVILFGEWLLARHSVPYLALPDHFVAFDVYDRRTEKFWSRPRFHAAMRTAGLAVAPVVAVRDFASELGGQRRSRPHAASKALETALRALLETRSRFRTDGGPVEGVVLRVDDADGKWLKRRCKIVRPDFVAGCGDGHWATRAIERQRVDYELASQYLSECHSLAPPVEPAVVADVNAPPTPPPETQAAAATHVTDPRTRLDVTLDDGKVVTLPRNFSWLWPGEVAVSSTLEHGPQVAALNAPLGVTLVVTLIKEEPLRREWFDDRIRNLFVPVTNYEPPTTAQMDEIVDAVVLVVGAGGAVMEHCGGGKGRAGTVAACLLLRFGERGVRAQLAGEQAFGAAMSSDEAIALIRRLRPGSIETARQERFVREYARELWRRAAEAAPPGPPGVLRRESSESRATAEDDAIAEDALLHGGLNDGANSVATAPPPPPPPSKQPKPSKAAAKARREQLKRRAGARKSAPRHVVLVGLPGSGKSTFAAALARHGGDRAPGAWAVASQDDLGRRACVQLVGRSAGRRRLVLDRCNVAAAERREWVHGLMHAPPRDDVACVYFEADVDACIARVAAREDHPTIPRGHGEGIVRSFASHLEPPTVDEGLYARVEVVRSREDADALLRRWGAYPI